MLGDLIDELIRAKDVKEIEKAYRMLERVGVDRYTARVMANERKKILAEQKGERT